jgi:regulator of sigma E protease
LEILIQAMNWAKIAVGLGVVIFIHELGHFLLAKWNGVKVEKFSIGFGPTIAGFRRGETEYVIAALPLGGFVKMLGESPEDEASKSTDPRAYPNKSVSARMAIISAGVIMNVFLAFGCFAFYYSTPRVEQPPVLGVVTAASPAYLAGLRPGDEIVAIDGRSNLAYADLLETVVLSSSGQVMHLQVNRPGSSGPIDIDLEASADEFSDRPTIGVVGSHNMELAGFRPLPGVANPPTFEGIPEKELQTKADVVVSAGPKGEPLEPLAGPMAYERLASKYRGRDLTLHIDRTKLTEDGEPGAVLSSTDLTLPPNHFVDFGLKFAIEPISGVRKGSPADAAGFRTGDRIKKVDGQTDLDPLRLPEFCFDKAGKPIEIEVERSSALGQPATVTLTVTPDDSPPYRSLVQEVEPVDVPGLGLCYPIDPKIVAVLPDSPAAKAGLKAGDVIDKLTLRVAEQPKKGVKLKTGAKPKTTDLDFHFKERPATWWSSKEPAVSWWGAFIRLQERQYQDVEFTVNGAKTPVRIMPEPNSKWFFPIRGVEFQVQRRTLPAEGFTQAVTSGFHRTIRTVLIVYSTFRSLFQRRVSIKHLGGPIMIFRMGYSAAGTSFSILVFFLGILSVNLAVLNFLPVPPLDGGQMVFLIAEKVRGRPLPDTAMIAGQWVGVALLLCLMVFVTYQDIYRWFTGWM